MDLYEIEGKLQYQRFGIPVRPGFMVNEDTDPDALEYPCVVKAQVLAGHRGQAGGVKIAKNPDEFRQYVESISGLVIRGKKVMGILVAPCLEIRQEMYLGITLDTVNKHAVMIFTPFGGMDIEELSATYPEKLVRTDVTDGFSEECFRKATAAFGIPEKHMVRLAEIAGKLTEMFFALDATTVEINPLIVNSDDELEAIDSKIVLDDNALYRQGNYTVIPRVSAKESSAVEEAKSADLVYVELNQDGNIGLIAGGAGIGMATVDTIQFYGGKAFNFLDLGGGVTADKTYAATKLLLENPKIEMVLVNVFGGINNCEIMATGIARAIKELGSGKKVMVKSRGHGQEEGWRILAEAGCMQVRYGTTDDAVKKLLGKE